MQFKLGCPTDIERCDDARDWDALYRLLLDDKENRPATLDKSKAPNC